jgi:hypothetical protein
MCNSTTHSQLNLSHFCFTFAIACIKWIRRITQNIATISAGFEKGDFLVREEQGNRVYFDFFEEVC